MKKILRKHGISNWRAKKRPFLTEEVARKRYLWCKARKNWAWRNFYKHNVRWSGKCSAERGKGKSAEWVLCTPPWKWGKEVVKTFKKGKNISAYQKLGEKVETSR